MAEIEIGIGKSGRRAYGFDDIAIVPSRRTRDPEDVDITLADRRLRVRAAGAGQRPWTASMSPRTVIELGRLGGLGVLNLEGLWTRYEDPEPFFEEIATLDGAVATTRMQEIYKQPVQEELIGRRIEEMKAAGITTAASASRRRRSSAGTSLALDAGLDILVIQGTVVSAEHVSTHSEPLNLKDFIARYEHARGRRRLRLVLVGAAPHAHRRGGDPRRGRARATPAPRAACWASASRRPPRSPTRPARAPPPGGDGPLRPHHRRRRHAHRRRRRQGDRGRRGRRDAGFPPGARDRGARPRLPLGHGDVPPRPAPRRPRGGQPDRVPARDPARAPRTRTTAR